MEFDLLVEPIWYKDDIMGMVETCGQRRKKNEGKRKDDIPKNEDDFSIGEFQ